MVKGRGGKSVEVNQEVEGDYKLTALVSQLNDLAIKIYEVENQCKYLGRESSRSYENKLVKDKLLIILKKLHEQDRMLEA